MFSLRQEIIFIINLYYRTLAYIEQAVTYLSERVDRETYKKDFDNLDYCVKEVKSAFQGCKLVYKDSRIGQNKSCELAFLECLHLYYSAESGLYNLGQIPKLIEKLDKKVGLPYYYVAGEVFRGESMEPSKQAIHACLFLDSCVGHIKSPHISRIAALYGIDITMYNKTYGYKHKKKC